MSKVDLDDETTGDSSAWHLDSRLWAVTSDV